MNDSMDPLDYTELVDDAMRGVVKRALWIAREDGLADNHHFYVSFNTNYPGVMISPDLRAQYPDDMTIVLQHQFWDLEVGDDRFSVMLSFNNVPERLVVPYEALTAFADPSVRFGLQLNSKPLTEDIAKELLHEDEPVTSFENEKAVVDSHSEEEVSQGEKVIPLDHFRKS